MVRREGRKPTKTMWIFCEGKTERSYFLKLRQTERISRLNIKVKDSENSDAKGVVEYAKKFKNHHSRDFEEDDLIFCVFDRDANSEQQLEQASSLAKEQNIAIIFSNPCFEYWILCHFGYFPNSYEIYDLNTKLRDYIRDYTKNDPEIFLKTKLKINDAVASAIKIRDKHVKENTKLISKKSNPLSLVFEIIQKLNEFKS